MRGQNTSSAVMQQRQEARDALDDFPTPMWATRALCEWLTDDQHLLGHQLVREPCANRGYMAIPLKEYFSTVEAFDVHDYGVGYPVHDYLFGPLPDLVDWTVMNPPFRLAQQFIERALKTSKQGVAVFCRSAFLEGGQRFLDLFSKQPPSMILQFTERVVLHKGVMRQAGEKYWDAAANDGEGKMRRASSATAYCWIIWEAPVGHTSGFDWIAPSRRRLERPGDYDVRGNSCV